jgi:type IV pilus assembly protein PilN
MIRVPINLATEPFRRTRAALAASAGAAALLLVLLLVQISWIAAERRQAGSTRSQIETLNARLEVIVRQQGSLDGVLRRPDNAAVLDQSLLLNWLIERKAVSWTRLFEDLGKVVPYNVQLVSVRLPQIDTRNRVLLDMVVGAKDPAPIIELLHRLETAPEFGSPQAPSSVPPGQNEKLLRYRIIVHYAQKL